MNVQEMYYIFVNSLNKTFLKAKNDCRTTLMLEEQSSGSELTEFIQINLLPDEEGVPAEDIKVQLQRHLSGGRNIPSTRISSEIVKAFLYKKCKISWFTLVLKADFIIIIIKQNYNLATYEMDEQLMLIKPQRMEL